MKQVFFALVMATIFVACANEKKTSDGDAIHSDTQDEVNQQIDKTEEAEKAVLKVEQKVDSVANEIDEILEDLN